MNVRDSQKPRREQNPYLPSQRILSLALLSYLLFALRYESYLDMFLHFWQSRYFCGDLQHQSIYQLSRKALGSVSIIVILGSISQKQMCMRLFYFNVQLSDRLQQGDRESEIS